MVVAVIMRVRMAVGRGCRLVLGALAFSGEDHGGRGHARQFCHRLLAGLAQGLLGGPGAGVDLQNEADIAALDHKSGNHAEFDHILAMIGVYHTPQRVDDLRFRHPGHA